MRVQSTVEGIERDGFRAFAYEQGVTPTSAAEAGSPLATAATEVRIEPVRWSVIIAGVFASIAALTMLGLLAAAIGLPHFVPEAIRAGNDTGAAVGAFVTAAIVAILALGLGGWVAARLSVLHTVRTGVLCGALVWAVSVPLVYLGAQARHATMMSSYNSGNAIAAPTMPGAMNGAMNGTPDNGPAVGLGQRGGTLGPTTGQGPMIGPGHADVTQLREDLTRGERIERAQRLGGMTFIALLLGLGAAIGGGLLGNTMRARGTGMRGERRDLRRDKATAAASTQG